LWAAAMLFSTFGCLALGQNPPAGNSSQAARAVGTVKSRQSDLLIVTPDEGAEITASLGSSTKILRIPPGENDLLHATPISSQDLQPGDRVLVRGQNTADGKSIAARVVVVMKQADVRAKQERDRLDWQKRGVGGPVTAVDAASGTISISSAGAGETRIIAIHTTKTTRTRRYAPDSVKFDDARTATVDQIKAGDQLRARGNLNADGSEVVAEEIVFGSFRNLAGTISSIDSAANSMTVQDAIGKSSVVVKITRDSQIKKLPPEISQRLAMRLKGGPPAQSVAGPPRSAPGDDGGSAPAQQASPATNGGHGPNGSGGPPDLQRLLARMPVAALTDLNKGDAVMIVATQGSDPGSVTAITVLGGVEPILTASPNRALTLSPWSLGVGEGDSAP
jgi:hypothetical protein